MSQLDRITEAEWKATGRVINPRTSIDVMRRWVKKQTPAVRRGVERTRKDLANAVTNDGADKKAVAAAYKRFVEDDLTPIWIASFHSAGRHMRGYMKSVDPYDIADGWQWAGGIEALTAWIKDHAGELIKYLTDKELESIRAQLHYWTHVEIIPTLQIAAKLKDHVGLLPRQWGALEKYRQNLLDEGTAGPLMERRIAKQRARMLKVRTQTIARTEIADAWNIGQVESAKAGLEAGDIYGKLHKRWWVSDPCETCASNAAAGVIEIDEPYPSGHQHPTAHPNCMCCEQLVTR